MVLEVYSIFYYNALIFLILTNMLIFVLTCFVFFVFSQNFIFFLVLNEILIFSLMLQFLVVGFIFDDLSVQVFVLLILVISSCELVIGLSLIISYFISIKTINIKYKI